MRFKAIVGAKRTQRAITKQTRTWVFYYVVNRGNDRIVIGTYDCKQPERTNLRKEQKEYWKRKDVTGTGYTTELSDPFLVWPQSDLNRPVLADYGDIQYAKYYINNMFYIWKVFKKKD